MLTALMSGKALTATELAAEAGVTIQTASAHLKKLMSADMISVHKQGRHKYFALADDDIGAVLEALMGLAAKRGLLRTRTGPKDPALRKARICYDHLAGDLGVDFYEYLIKQKVITEMDGKTALTPNGFKLVEKFGINTTKLTMSKRPICLSCLDWSVRRNHLAGSLGAAFLTRFYELGWSTRVTGTRVINFSNDGEKNLLDCLNPKHQSIS